MKLKSGIIAVAITMAIVSSLFIVFSVAVVGTANAAGGMQITIVPSGSPLIVDGNVLALANGVSKMKIKAYVTDVNGTPLNGVPVYLKDAAGHNFNFMTGNGGYGYTQTLNVGPHFTSYSETITASLTPDFSADTNTCNIRFIQADLAVTADDSDVKVGASTMIHVSMKDGLTPMANVPVLLTIYESNSTQVTVPLITDGSGMSSYSFSPPNITGVNIVAATIGKLSLMDTMLIYSTGDEAFNVSIHPYPSDSVLADGHHNHMILAQVVDRFGNGVGAGNPVTISDQYGDSVVVYTSDQGWVNAVSMPSVYPGVVHYNATFVNSSGTQSVPFVLKYTTGSPSIMTLNAYPNSVASGEVINQHLGYDINTSQIVAYVADSYNHPLPGERVTVSVEGTNGSLYDRTNSSFVQTITNKTDINGQFIVALNVSPYAYYSGAIRIDAISNNTDWGTSLQQSTTVTYTNQSHLNVTTSVDKHIVALNDTFNVTVNVDGVGWQEGRPPIDLMLVLDKSGSMGDAMNNINGNFVYDPVNGGWFAPTDYSGDENNITANNSYVRVGSFPHNFSTRMVVNMNQVKPVAMPPVAAFNATPLIGNKPLNVQFTDQSTSYPATWSWTFGDGGTSNLQNPSHTYVNGGIYTVSLAVTNSAGSNTLTKTSYITVNTPVPVATFTGNQTTGLKPLCVAFTDSSTNSPTSWSWTFGDGGTSNLQNPVHTYSNAGQYTVVLTATNSGGSNTMTKTNYITVNDPVPPTANFIGNQTSGPWPFCVKFTDQSTGTLPLTWAWDFGDGSTSTVQNPVHTYLATGTYTVSLTATNVAGTNTTTKTNYITVSNPIAPVADFSASPTSGFTTLWVQFTDLTTGSNPKTYQWNFGDGTGNSTAQNPSHSYATAGTYTVTLTVTNAAGTSGIQKSNYITVTQWVNPTISWTASPPSGTATPTVTVTFTDTSTGLDITQHYWYIWDDTGGPYYVAYSATATHTYRKAGTYQLTDWVYSSSHGWFSLTGTYTIASPTPSPSPSPTATPSPVVDFIGTPTSGLTPLTVAFTDKSTNSPTSWSWNFGDGGTDIVQNPSHTYTTAGTYTVTLIASNSGGSGSKTRIAYITVTDPVPPTAIFDGAPVSGYWPLNVQFTDHSTGSPALSYQWNFGDGPTNSTDQSPVHQYGSAGIYTVTLTVNNPYGSDTLVKTNYITVGNPTRPTAQFTAAPVSGNWPLNVQFTDQTTGTPPFTSWLWDFGDSVTSAAQSPAHTYNATGTYTVKLTVSNAAGTDSITKTNLITVYPTLVPVTEFSANPQSGTMPLAVNFQDLTTNSPISWSWNFGDGGTSTLQNPSHPYATPGSYTVILTASNAAGSNTMTKTNYITVYWPMPVANFFGSPLSGNIPLTVNFHDTTSNNPISWAWDFGDGSTSNSQNPSYTYSTPGLYTVTLRATNPTGSDTKTIAGYVTVKPVASFTATPTSGSRPLPVQFTDTSAGNPDSWSWNFGDGGTSTAQSPLHSYSSSGTYTVTLTVTANGTTDTMTKTSFITVNSVIPHGVTQPSDDTYMFELKGPNGTVIGPYAAGSQKILFGGLASTDDGSIVAQAATPGTYEIWAKRTYSQGAKYGYDVQFFDQMKLGQSVDNDSAAKMGSRELINSLWVTDRAGLVTFSDYGTVDAPLAYLNGTPMYNLINSINATNSYGWTDTYGGMAAARQQFESHVNPRPDVEKIEVLLTDGYAINSTLSGDQEKALCQQEATRALADGIKIYTIGIGNDSSAVDGAFLQEMADMTGGTYQFCSNYQQIWDAFKNIGYQLEQNITTTSDLNLVPERTDLSGIWYNNTTYIPGTGKTWTDGNTSNPGSYSPEPAISQNGNMYNLSWSIDPIKLSHTWTLKYQVTADKVGYTHPIGNTSYAAVHVYNSSDIVPVPLESDLVYVSSNLTDDMSDMNMLSVQISLPYEGYPITQPTQDLLWNVTYHGIATYTVIKEYAPYGVANPKWTPIGGVDSSNRTGVTTFSDIWNMGSLVPPGKYTIRINATDGLFSASSLVNFTVQYVPGQINVVNSR